MTLLSLLTRPVSVSCLLLFGIAPAFLHPNLWAASRAGTKPSTQVQIQNPSILSQEKAQWTLFHEISEGFRGENPQEALKKASVFLLRWPKSPMSDSVRLMAAASASRLGDYNQSLVLCDGLQDSSLKEQVLSQRLYWLYALNRFEEAYQLGLNSSFDSLNAERRAWGHYYIAEALYKETVEKNKDLTNLTKEEKERLEKACALYTSSQEIIGYMATFQSAKSAEVVGLTEMAAHNYLKASSLPGADSAKCRYLAARLLVEIDSVKAKELSQALISENSPWQAPAAFLWMQMCLKNKEPQDVLHHMDWVKIASQSDSIGALYFLGSAQMESDQKQDAVKTLTDLMKACKKASQTELEAYGKPGIMRLADLYQTQHDPKLLVEFNENLGSGKWRSQDYFYVCLKAGRLFDQLNNKEEALRQYSQIVTQAPQVAWVGESLLRKGLLEADKKSWVASWSSLDLYLRLHATDQGYKKAWPVFLEVTSFLQEYQASSTFNKQRFALVLDRLKAFKCADDEKINWIRDETERVYKTSSSETELWLMAVKTKTPLYFTPDRELLMAMARADADSDLNGFIARSQAAIGREKAGAALLEVRYASYLRSMGLSHADLRSKAYENSAIGFISSFEKEPAGLSKEDIIWTAQWIQSHIQQPLLGSGIWANFFIDPIYSRAQMKYQPLTLEADYQKWASSGAQILQNLLNRGQADQASRLLLARFQWAASDFKSCLHTLSTLEGAMISEEKTKNPSEQSLLRPYLIYDLGANLLSGNTQKALDVWKHLMPLVDSEKDTSLSSSLRMTLARACVSEGDKQPKKTQWYTQALDLYSGACVNPCSEFEPIYMEGSIEKAMLLGHHLSKKAKQDPYVSTYTELLTLKRHYVEADTDYTQALHARMESHKETKACWQSYMILLDALVAEYQGFCLLQGDVSKEDKEEATAHFSMAKKLYGMLASQKYGITSYLKEKSAEGLLRIQAVEK